jgi:MFS family permease
MHSRTRSSLASSSGWRSSESTFSTALSNPTRRPFITETPVTNALVAEVVAARRMGAAMGVFGTISDIGEAAGPIIAGFLIGRLACAAAFDVTAVATVAATLGFAPLVSDPGTRSRRSD